MDVAVGAVDVTEAIEDVDGEGGVAEPGEAVVPVAGAADGLGQAGGGSGDDCAGAGEHHQVEDEEGSDDLVAPEAVVVHVLHEALPIASGLPELALGLAALEAGGAAAAEDEDEGGGLASGQGEAGGDALAVDVEGDAGEEGEGLADGAGLDGGGGGLAVEGTELGDSAGVVVAGAELAAHVDVAGEAGDNAVYLVGRVRRRRGGVAVVVAGYGHEVGHGDDAGGGGEGGLEDVGVVEVALLAVEAVGGGGDAEVAAEFVVEDGGEDAGGVEAGKAAPVDRAVGADQRRGGHIAYQSILVQVRYAT